MNSKNMKEEDTKLHDNDAAAHPPVRLKYEKYTRTPLSRASCVSLLFTSTIFFELLSISAAVAVAARP
jgi:hypothetical protein